MQPIQLKLTIDETNVILKALGEMPYVQVHQLIAKIHQQASSQLQEGNDQQVQVPESEASNPESLPSV